MVRGCATITKTLSAPETYTKHELEAWDRFYQELDAQCAAIRLQFEERHGVKINCAEFHRQLKTTYPFAVMWYSMDHIMTEVNGFVCDKRGIQFYRIHSGFAASLEFNRTFNAWPVHNGPLDGTDKD